MIQMMIVDARIVTALGNGSCRNKNIYLLRKLLSKKIQPIYVYCCLQTTTSVIYRVFF